MPHSPAVIAMASVIGMTVTLTASAQVPPHRHAPDGTASPGGGVRLTMEDPHRHGGVTAQAGTTGARPGETLIELAIEKRKLVSPQKVVRVRQGDAVRLRWTADERTEIHLHGYDLSVVVAPDKPADLQFTARATGRFPFTIHGKAGDGHQGGHEHGGAEVTLGHLEVLPR